NGITALHCAAYGRVAAVQWLLQKGADPNAKDSRGLTPLHVAVSYDSTKTEIVAALINSGADVNAITNEGYRPLHQAVGARNKAVAQLLLKHGAKDDSTPLFDAIAHGDLTRVEELLKTDPTMVRDTALPASVKNRKHVFLSGPGIDNISPLHAAVFWGDTAIVARLIEGKAPLEVNDRNGETPLHEAVNLNELAIAKLLLDRGAQVNARAYRRSFHRYIEGGFTPLHFAVIKKDVKMVTLLIECGGNINARTTSRRTPLDFAELSKKVEVVVFLKARGATNGEYIEGNIGYWIDSIDGSGVAHYSGKEPTEEREVTKAQAP
ncbi:MAG TPA: ankyrin repeat domain-containing protein, partial [Abditibacteriaceae bacterium]